MMISDDYTHSLFFGGYHGFARCSTAINGNNQLRRGLFNQACKCLEAEAIAFIIAIRQKCLYLCTKTLQNHHNHGGCRNPVRIIVTEDRYPFTLADCRPDAFGCNLHPAKFEGVRQVLHLRIQEVTRTVRISVPP